MTNQYTVLMCSQHAIEDAKGINNSTFLRVLYVQESTKISEFHCHCHVTRGYSLKWLIVSLSRPGFTQNKTGHLIFHSLRF